ncbi:Uncharacterised protein [Scardovia inopinata]|uniref:Uncharacterized protein n=1 Tax=Scardovia inopinata F0304 TaxID=641146 RepID=W5IK22_SCAIO|nr:hypothetical protein [Scardovia inopinata]EFG27221.2 hypothetical protein HMPREF9020_00860 [Scardovia inopinata F0304]BAR06832.1 hypothetical protein SCIP_0765 [Scardovia inopinata JCM 12537]SUV50893.1 Uncharacterised protein [Scardovia inopinata]
MQKMISPGSNTDQSLDQLAIEKNLVRGNIRSILGTALAESKPKLRQEIEEMVHNADKNVKSVLHRFASASSGKYSDAAEKEFMDEEKEIPHISE